MKFTDEEIEMLHQVLIEETVYAPEGRWGEDDDLILGNLLSRVSGEARARDLWWAR